MACREWTIAIYQYITRFEFSIDFVGDEELEHDESSDGSSDESSDASSGEVVTQNQALSVTDTPRSFQV